MLKELLGTFSENIIEAPFSCDFGTNVHLGKNVYVNRNCVFIDVCEIRIGNGTLLSPGMLKLQKSFNMDEIIKNYF